MKKINKISIFLFLLVGITFTSCETTELDLLDDPNNITLDKAELNRYLVAIQVDFANFVESIGRTGAQLTRLENMRGRTYSSNFTASSTDFEWELAYQGMFSDMKGAELLALADDSNKHIGVMKVMQAYTLMTLVDFFGDVPYSEATNPSEFPFPNVDDDAAVYQAALNLLDESITYLNLEGDNLENDFFYNNDFTKWVKLANTLKMRAYLNTRLVDSDARNKFNSIISSGNYISDANGGDDFQFNYGSNVSSPDTRHPAFAADYTITGAGRYRSNWIMDNMFNNNDPRRFYYFYRQAECTPGFEDCPPSNVLACSGQTRPQHYVSGMVFCTIAAGYWGADHGFDGGIPPDGLSRTTVGIYPSGGKYDSGTNRDGTIELVGSSYEFVYDTGNNSAGESGGLNGAGITPIVLASSVDFWRAEFALANGQIGAASSFVQSGITKSISKITTGFAHTSDAEFDGSLILDDVVFDSTTGVITTPSTSGDLVPTSADNNAFINAQSALITDTSDSSWNALAEQYFISQYGNGVDTYNFYRRTGFPKTLQFNIEENSGNIPRSLLYPQSEATTNNNITQKEDLDGQIFWDNNPSSPGFPFSN